MVRVVAERMRQAIIDLDAAHARSEIGRVSISIGTATSVLAGVTTADDLVRRADDALYEAKDAGRDRVCEAGTDRSVPRDGGDGSGLWLAARAASGRFG
jgi:diguanylate cyclase (GGDEF)-like protein